MAIYAERVSELPRLLNALFYHPQGMSIRELAAEVGRTEDQVRETLLAYYTTDFAGYVPDLVFRPEVIEFFGGSDDSDGIRQAPMVRLVASRPGRELGVAYASVAELARMYRAGRDRLLLEPDNAELASAVTKLRERLLPGFQSGVIAGEPPPEAIIRALRERRRLLVRYARAWQPEVIERVIEPYRLTRSRRGWELDAGPVEDDGDIRTFLLSALQEYQLLPDGFEPPPDLDTVIRRHRRQTRVELNVPHEYRWAVDKYAESVRVIREDETEARLAVQLLPPLRLRVGLMLLAGGPQARVIAPVDLADAGRELARTLLAHYESDG